MITNVIGNSLGVLTASTDKFNGIYMSSSTWGTAITTQNVMSISGTFSNFGINCDAGPGAGLTRTFWIYINGSNTGITIALTGAGTGAGVSTGSDMTHTATFSAGDTVSIHSTATGTTTSAGVVRWTMAADSGAANVSMILGATGSATGATFPCYVTVSGDNTDTVLANVESVISTAGTIKNAYAVLNTNATANTTFTLVRNSTDTAVTFTVASGAATGNDTTHSFSVSAGDKLYWRLNASGAASKTIAISVEFDPTIDGESVHMYGHGGKAVSTTVVRYQTIPESGSAFSTIEPSQQNLSQAAVWKKLYVFEQTTLLAGTYQFQPQYNGSSGNLTVTMSTASQTGNDTTNTDTTSFGDTISMKLTPALSPTASQPEWGIVSYIAPGGTNASVAQTSANLVLSGGQQSVIPLATNVVSYYKLDDASGTTAVDSAGSNNGTWQGTTGSQWGTGIINGDGVFNGTNNYVLSGSNSGISGNAEFTLSSWFKTTSISAGQCVISFGVTATALGAVSLYLNINGNGSISAEFAGGNGYRSASGQFTANTWHHFVVSKVAGAINTTTKMYLDGVAIASSVSSTSTPSITNAPFYIGQFGTSGSFMVGQVDEVGIWSRALNATDVALLYNGGSGLQYPFTSSTNASITQVHGSLTLTGGTQTLASVQKASITQSAASLTLTGRTQTVSTTNIVSTSVTQVHGSLILTGGTQSIATVNDVAVTQSAANLVLTGGTQVVAGVAIVSTSVSQVSANLVLTGGTQVIATGSIVSASITQVHGTLTLTGGTQAISTTQIAGITQTHGSLLLTGGTQAVTGVNIATIAQAFAALTLTGGTQSVAGTVLVNASITQTHGSLILTGGSQTIATTRDALIAQLSANLVLTGGTQVLHSSSTVASISQFSASLRLTGGTQSVVTISRLGRIEVYNGSSFALHPVNVWDGSTWVRRKFQYYDGSKWITTL